MSFDENDEECVNSDVLRKVDPDILPVILIVLAAGGIWAMAKTGNIIYGNMKSKCRLCNQLVKNKELYKIDKDKLGEILKEFYKINEEKLGEIFDEIERSKGFISKYVDKKICSSCRERFDRDIKDAFASWTMKKKQKREKQRQEEEQRLRDLEKQKVPCLRCRKRFLLNEYESWSNIELSEDGSWSNIKLSEGECWSDIELSEDKIWPDIELSEDECWSGLPYYWIIMINKNEQLCSKCVLELERKKYEDIKRKIEDDVIKSIPKTYKGKLEVCDTLSEEKSHYYKNKAHAEEELLVRAGHRGFDVVINLRYHYRKGNCDNYRYKMWKAIGDFAKWKN